MEIEIRNDQLRALFAVAPKKDTRYYLNGAHFDCGPHGVIGVATDGHCMIIMQISDTPMATGTLFAPSSWKVPANKWPLLLTNETVESDLTDATLRHFDGSLTWRGEVGRFPDWRKVIPSDLNNEPCYVDAHVFAPLVAAAKILGHAHGPCWRPSGESAALVTFNQSDVFGIVMPMRVGLASAPPEWFTGPCSAAA